MMLAENFDAIEESLRNDLRRNDHVINAAASRSSLQENFNSRQSDRIALELHNQADNFRNTPSRTEHFQPDSTCRSPLLKATAISPLSDVNHGMPHSNADDFKSYYSLLTDRIRKVEEQNLELLRIAERQKFEYDKVVAQVVESEQSQRLLINECCSLRQQVQQLACHNRKLKDQQKILTHDPSLKEDSLIGAADVRNVNSPSQKSITKNNFEQVTEALKQLQRNNETATGNCPSDLTIAVELIAALQLAAQANHQAPVVMESLSSPSHVKSRPNSELSTISENRDFSNHKCSDSKSGANDQQNLNAQLSERLSSPAHHRFNQNGNTPSEAQRPISTHSIAAVTDNDSNLRVQSANLRQDSRLRRSQTRLNSAVSKQKEFQRPSSLVINSDFSLSRMLSASRKVSQTEDYAPTKSPVSTPTTPKSFVSQRLNRLNGISTRASYVQSCAELSTAETDVWIQRKSTSSSSLLDDTFRNETKQQLSNQPQNGVPGAYVEINSPMLSLSPEVSKVRPDSVESKCEKTKPKMPANNRSSLDKELLEQPLLSQDFSELPSVLANGTDEKITAEAEIERQVQDNSAIVWRRHSYGRACRKSRSFDLMNESANELTSASSESPHLNLDEIKDNQQLDTEIVSTFDDSGFVSPKNQLEANYNAVQESKSKHEKRPPKLIRSQSKKNVSNETQTNGNEPDYTAEDKRTNLELEGTNAVSEKRDSRDFIVAEHNFRSRGYSDGSAGLKKKSKLFSESDKKHLKRQISVGGNFGRNKANKSQNPISLPCHETDFAAITNDDYVTQDSELISNESFISTNDFQLASSAQHPKTKPSADETNSQQKIQTKSFRGLKLPQNFSSSKNNSVDASASPLPNTPDDACTGDLSKRSKPKLSKRSKSINVLNKKDKTCAGPPSKSLVNIVKSKFVRSSSTAKLSLASEKNQLEPSRRSVGPRIIKPITPCMKPAMSLDEVVYLPPGKDGDQARKLKKQKHILLEECTDAVDYSTNISDEILPKDTERRASEDILSDEGFADGSTIERSETEDNQLPEDIELLRSKMFALSKSNSEPKTNTVSSTESENSGCSNIKPTEDAKWCDRDQVDVQNGRASFDDGKLRSSKTLLDPGVFATGVTIVPTSALRPTSRAVASPNRFKSKKIPKSPNESAISRLFKNVSKNVSSSQEDLSQSKDFASKLNQGKEMRKNKLSGYQRDIEQAFMSSIVQAELSQGLQGRSSSPESISKNKADDNIETSCPTSNAKLDESTGTGSSISSLLSMGTVSMHSGDSSDGQPIEMGMSQLPNSSFASKANFAPISRLRATSTPTKNKPRAASAASALYSKLSENPPRASESKLEAGRLPEAQAVSEKSVGIQGTPQKSSPMRSSKLAAPSKLMPSGKTSGLIKSKVKLREKTSLPTTTNQAAKTKLAPLNYGSSPVQDKPAARSKASSIHIVTNSPTLQVESPARPAEAKAKSGLSPPRNAKPSLKIPVSRSSARCGSTQLEGPKSRSSSIPSTGLCRPKPVFNVSAS